MVNTPDIIAALGTAIDDGIYFVLSIPVKSSLPFINQNKAALESDHQTSHNYTPQLVITNNVDGDYLMHLESSHNEEGYILDELRITFREACEIYDLCCKEADDFVLNGPCFNKLFPKG